MALDGASAKLKWAHEELMRLKDEIAALPKRQVEVVTAKPKRTNPKIIQYRQPNRLISISASIGSFAVALRSALDQMVYALSELDSGKQGKRTQFPIYDLPKDFQRGVAKDLEGISMEHRATIERLQPYNGGRWLSTIQRLSNDDKHRRLIRIVGTGITFRGSAVIKTKTYLDNFIPVDGSWTPRTVEVDSRITGKIAFADGTPIIDTLEILQAEVRAVVDAFKPLFED
jgi:hypothetical protein